MSQVLELYTVSTHAQADWNTLITRQQVHLPGSQMFENPQKCARRIYWHMHCPRWQPRTQASYDLPFPFARTPPSLC